MELTAADGTLFAGCAATLGIALFMALIAKFAFSSQEEAYGAHISALYGKGGSRSKSSKQSDKKKKGALLRCHLFYLNCTCFLPKSRHSIDFICDRQSFDPS